MKFSVFQVSRQGGREKNEDRMGYCYTRESGLFLLADGMGGHPEGEVAAQLALQTISALYQKEARPVIDNVAEFLASALIAAHQEIIRYASRKGLTRPARRWSLSYCRAQVPLGRTAVILGSMSYAMGNCWLVRGTIPIWSSRAVAGPRRQVSTATSCSPVWDRRPNRFLM
jgi:hypothetical protein